MGLFRNKKKSLSGADAATLAQRSLDFISEGVLVVNHQGVIIFANPAAAAMTGYNNAENITGLDFQLVIHLENHQETPIEPDQSELYTAVHTNQRLETRDYVLVAAQSERRYSIALSCIPTGNERADRIITFRDITTELTEEREQAEFISTASHEMRTPVASIEGYLGLSLNPQTATIDERARKYLEAAHAASQHLGHLFKDLLDVTKFDDSRANAHFIPVDAVEAVSYIANEQAEAMKNKNIRYTFGGSKLSDKKQLTQKIYMAVDYDFLREIVTNLVGNAVKYTPEGGSIKVSVKGEGDKVLITVTDNGIGIPSDDLGHIFQKFYRVDSTQTREIGGTGLGLYLVKQRVEAMNGRVWVESDFGHGSSFYVTLPRISESEYERMRIAYGNEKMMRTPFVAPVVGTVDANIEIPSAGVTATVTHKSDIAIKQGGANLSTPATESSTPVSADSIGGTANTPNAGVSEIKPETKPAMSSMIKSHSLTVQDESAPAEDTTSAATGDEPQIFERKSLTLMPKSGSVPAPTDTPNTQSAASSTSTDSQPAASTTKKVISPPSSASGTSNSQPVSTAGTPDSQLVSPPTPSAVSSTLASPPATATNTQPNLTETSTTNQEGVL